jgi:chromosome segregation ATPase
MTATERLRHLEDEVEQLKTWAGPGQIQALLDGQRALRADMAQVKVILERHDRLLQGNKKDVAGLKTDVAGLKTDVAGLKTDVAGLKTDVAGLKTDVAELRTDVAELKSDMAEVKTRLDGLPDEIVRRLREAPPAG